MNIDGAKVDLENILKKRLEREMEKCKVIVLEDKYNERSRDSNIQQLLPARGMVARTLRKMHCKIIRRLSQNFRKAKYLFTRMNIDGAKVDRENILKKRQEREMERC